MPLREYQDGTLTAMVDYYRQGVTRQLVDLPTGTGKTLVFGHIPQRARLRSGQKMLVLTHLDELCWQAHEKIQAINPDLKVGVEKADHHADLDADVIVGSVQTLGKSRVEKDTGKVHISARLAKFDPDSVRIVVADEAHHLPAPIYEPVLRWFNVYRPDAAYDDPSKLLLGVTATPRRADGVGMDTYFQRIIYSRGLLEMIKAGWLTDVQAWRAYTDVDISDVDVKKGDFVTKQLSEKVNTPERNHFVVQKYRELGQNLPAIAFTVDIQHSEDLAETFRKEGIQAYAISSRTKDNERRALIRAYRDGEIRVLVSCNALLEGFDAPTATVVLMCRPTKSGVLFRQALGRGLRPFPAPELLAGWTGWIKKFCIVIDFTDNLSGRHQIQSVPTIFGLPPQFDLKGQEATKAVEEVEALVATAKGAVDPTLFSDIRQLRGMIEKIDLWAKPTVPDEVRAVSKYGWFTGPTGGYTLLLPDRASFLVRENLLGQWEFYVDRNGTRGMVGQPFSSLAEALSAVDGFVPPEARIVLRQDANWRLGKPSDKQVAALGRHRPDLRTQFGTYDDFKAYILKSFSKGDVSDLLSAAVGQRGGGG